jgi:hypothetical protein
MPTSTGQSRLTFETLVTRLFRDRVDGTHAEALASRRQTVREVLTPILTFVSFMTSR